MPRWKGNLDHDHNVPCSGGCGDTRTLRNASEFGWMCRICDAPDDREAFSADDMWNVLRGDDEVPRTVFFHDGVRYYWQDTDHGPVVLDENKMQLPPHRAKQFLNMSKRGNLPA